MGLGYGRIVFKAVCLCSNILCTDACVYVAVYIAVFRVAMSS